MEFSKRMLETCTAEVLDTIKDMQRHESTEKVRLAYKWRIDKDDIDLLQGIINWTVKFYPTMPRDVATVITFVADLKTVIAAIDRNVLVGGEYLYYGPGKEIAEALAAEALARNAHKLRCGYCHKDHIYCNCANHWTET